MDARKFNHGKKKDTKPLRVDGTFYREIMGIPIIRIKKDLESRQLSSPEVTKLLMNAPSWPKVVEETTVLPRIKTVFKKDKRANEI